MPPRGPRRVRPLAGWSVVGAFVLIGVALLSTVWSTRATVADASDAVRRGQALALEQGVRTDLADLEGPPRPEELERILHDHADEGLRYIAMVEGRKAELVSEAGVAFGSGDADTLVADAPLQDVHGRLRIQVRPFKRMRNGGRNWRVLIEIEPVQASALRDVAARSLGIGALAAASLLGVAIVLVRRESRRNAEERVRERERRLASLGEMSAILAHEIKNPLASLKGNAQLLEQMLPSAEKLGATTDDDPLAKSRARSKRVVDETMRLERLVNELLQFVRTGTLKREPVDPVALVREAAASVPGDITVTAKDAPELWSLDAGRIREVVVNIVDNAVHAGPPVTVTVGREDKLLVIEVSDRGPGVPEEDREKIFEAFHTGKTQGTGLGLAVARRIVEQHDGAITVLRNSAGGALFRVEIPED